MIKFTEFILPNGKRVDREISLDSEVESKANYLIDVGFQFEIEILRNGMINMDCSRSEDDCAIASELGKNDNTLPLKVVKLIETAFERWKNIETKSIEIDSGSSS